VESDRRGAAIVSGSIAPVATALVPIALVPIALVPIALVLGPISFVCAVAALEELRPEATQTATVPGHGVPHCESAGCEPA
jgi:hypothetical protein